MRSRGRDLTRTSDAFFYGVLSGHRPQNLTLPMSTGSSSRADVGSVDFLYKDGNH